MTKHREPLTYHRTLTEIAARIGWDRCAAICGVSDRTVRYWSDPDCETEIRLIDAERLDRAYLERGGDHAPFHRLFALRLEVAAIEARRIDDLVSLAATSAREAGEAVAALVTAGSDANNPKARRAARQEIGELIEAMQRSLAAMDRIESEGGQQ